MATAETRCLAGLRLLEKALSHNTIDRQTLRLPADAQAWLEANGPDLTAALLETYGPRFDIVASDVKQPEVA